MHRAIRFTVVLTLVLSMGAHWAFLQSVAWLGMIVTYSRVASFAEAVSKTFDGEHPCGLCKVIQEGRAEEHRQAQEPAKSTFKMEMGVVWQVIAFDFNCDRGQIISFVETPSSRHDEPPKPPPRTSTPHSRA